MKTFRPSYLILLLLCSAFTLATLLQARVDRWSSRDKGSILQVLFGDGRRLFANHFFTKADVYFHSGYYPSIFDKAAKPKDSKHMTAEDNDGASEEEEHEKAMAFLGEPRDWIERFGRHFMITRHTHLENGQEREMLPWLKLSAELDPHRIDTYTVAAYWLRRSLGKPKEAAAFLREGLRNNPDSYELMYELGLLEYDNNHDAFRARNLWERALRQWTRQESGKKEPDKAALDGILVNLARLEAHEGNLDAAIYYFENAKKVSPNPQALQEQIDELKSKGKLPPKE